MPAVHVPHAVEAAPEYWPVPQRVHEPDGVFE